MILPIISRASTFSARSITFHRDRCPILKDVSLTLGLGECVAIVGPNGAGKSSLLKIFSGDLIPQFGEVRLDEIPIGAWDWGKIARRRAVLPQQSELFFPFSVRDVVLMGRSPYHGSIETFEDDRVVEEAMRATDVIQFQDRLYDRLSGGEKQRVQLARVLAQIWPGSEKNGGFLLLDEPTSSLDLCYQHRFFQTVRRFIGAGLGALVVLHDLNLAMQYADRVMVLCHGHSLACDVPEKAFLPELIREVFKIKVRVLRETALSHPVLVPVCSDE